MRRASYALCQGRCRRQEHLRTTQIARPAFRKHLFGLLPIEHHRTPREAPYPFGHRRRRPDKRGGATPEPAGAPQPPQSPIQPPTSGGQPALLQRTCPAANPPRQPAPAPGPARRSGAAADPHHPGPEPPPLDEPEVREQRVITRSVHRRRPQSCHFYTLSPQRPHFFLTSQLGAAVRSEGSQRIFRRRGAVHLQRARRQRTS